jgi:hypothetical protein
MINKIVTQTEELLSEKKAYHAPVARIVNIFGNRLMDGEVNWGGQQVTPAVGSHGEETTYTGGVPGTYDPGAGGDPDADFSKGFNGNRFFE